MSQNIMVAALVLIVIVAGGFGLWSDSSHKKKMQKDADAKNATTDKDQNKVG